MPKPKAEDLTDLIASLRSEYADSREIHPERAAQIEEQMAALGVPLESNEE